MSMSSITNFPIKFLIVGKKEQIGTFPGLYLRWFIKPYLGIPGISPLHSTEIGTTENEVSGFRVFYNKEFGDIPTRKPLPLDPVLPKPKDRDFEVSNVRGRPAWKACYNRSEQPMQVRLDFLSQYQHKVQYLRFNYSLFAEQELMLNYVVFSSNTQIDTKHQVPLHYKSLMGDLELGEYEDLTYAIHVDQPDESIVEVSFTTNGSLVIGDFYWADTSFYMWSPPRGADQWVEIPPDKYLFHELSDPLIQPAGSNELVEALAEFYQLYFGIRPSGNDGNKVTFEYPQLPQFQLSLPLTRDYLADQYEQLCEGKIESADNQFYMRPQDAAALASNDPAIAYLFGLFRVLNWDQDTIQERVYKVQGTWPDDKRFCIYSHYKPTRELMLPKIGSVNAAQKTINRVLRDYATFRVHHPINAGELSWDMIKTPSPPAGFKIWMDPTAYLILRARMPEAKTTCLSPFYIPRDEDISNDRVHYLDWYEFYKGTDINKVLDGIYRYHLSVFDIFGQMADFETADSQVEPIPQHIGEIQKPEITLTDPTSKPIDIPLEVEKTGASYRLKAYDIENLKFNFSFFWPLESRYVWTFNRKTEQPSLYYFNLLYMAETPLFALVCFKKNNNTASGIKVNVQEVRETGPSQQWKNGDLYALLKLLGATDSSGQLIPSIVTAALMGGKLSFGREFEITAVTVSSMTATITLQLMPTQVSKKEEIEQQGYVLPLSTEERNSKEINGRLYWNTEATHAGARLGWKTLSYAGEEITPSPFVDFSGNLISENKTPKTQAETPLDLEPKTGLAGYPSPQDEGDYAFLIKVQQGHPLFNHDRFRIVPLDKKSNLEPGEYKRSDLPQNGPVDVPISASTLFSEDRIFSFYAVRLPSDTHQPNQVTFRGDPLSFVSTAGNGEKEYLLYPDTQHTEWRIILPNTISKQVSLDSFLQGKRFKEDNYLITNLSIAVEIVVTGLDKEVKGSLQSAIAIKKLSFQEFLPPPVFSIPDQPQSSFGISASSPGYDGNSLIILKKIFSGYDLENILDAKKRYLLYRLPASRIVPESIPVSYAKNPASGNNYRRDIQVLKTKLEDLKKADSQAQDYLSAAAVQKQFLDYAEKVEEQALDKEAFLRLPVTLPGESRTVFLFAIKAYDIKVKKESEKFTCLSLPVYVEDTTKPAPPLIQSIEILRESNMLKIKAKVARKLDATDGYGFVSDSYLQSHQELRTAIFPHLVANYRIYLSNEREVVTNPDDSDFTPVFDLNSLFGSSSSGTALKRFSLKLLSKTLTLNEDGDTVQITANPSFSNAYDLINIPSELFVCVRAENYLGEKSPLSFFPFPFREVL